ncbi:helix-turn-helix domain-containing protein [Microbispora sp. NPDC088329]|uniref:winged helix-turn-helix transcriptional regulator n=1 Tax=Microbispora sp. NPDC088329 TaxID=3154869 RepID=UPI003431A2EB
MSATEAFPLGEKAVRVARPGLADFFLLPFSRGGDATGLTSDDSERRLELTMSGDLLNVEDGKRAEPARPAGPKARIPDCPLARTVETVGHWWTLEILHEVFNGHTRFEAIHRNLGTPADVLLDRIAQLMAKGLLETEVGAADPEDRTYRLTDLGRSLRPLILVMAAWGNHRLPPEDRSLVLVDKETGVAVDPVVVDGLTGRRIDTADHVFARGPKASEMIIARYPEIPGQR